MRLIDADEVIKSIKELMQSPYANQPQFGKERRDTMEAVARLCVEKIPTAYDIEKVVAELEERAEEHRELAFSMDSKNFCNIADRLYGKQVECLEIINIVRKGGVE